MSSAASPHRTLPISLGDWKLLAKKWNATGGMEDLGSPVKISSASKFEFQNFLGLQAIYNFPKERSTLPAAITRQFPSDSDCDLENVPGYTAYLNEIEKAAVNGISEDSAAQTRVSRNLNAFVVVWQLQRHVLVGDEQAADVLKVSQVSPASPVARRTRAKIRARQSEQAPATPTPAPRSQSTFLAMQTANLSLNEDVGFESDGDPEKDTIDDESAEDTGNISDDDDDESAEDTGNISDDDDDDNDEDPEQDEDLSDRFDTPALGPRGPSIRDEQTVNVFIIAFLTAIVATTVPFDTRWVAERNALHFVKNVRYTARVDGHLRNSRKGQSFSLIEVKPRERRDDISIRVQETAQIAAWISHNKIRSHDPDKKCEMFLLSQDKHELFLTFPYFGTDYGKPFTSIRDLKEKNFLRMCEYGPFDLTSKEHVNYIARFLINYTVHKSRQ